MVCMGISACMSSRAVKPESFPFLFILHRFAPEACSRSAPYLHQRSLMSNFTLFHHFNSYCLHFHQSIHTKEWNSSNAKNFATAWTGACCSSGPWRKSRPDQKFQEIWGRVGAKRVFSYHFQPLVMSYYLAARSGWRKMGEKELLLTLFSTTRTAPLRYLRVDRREWVLLYGMKVFCSSF